VRSRRGIVWALLLGITIVTVVYVLINLAMLRALGLAGMAGSMAIAADVMRQRFGGAGAMIVTAAVILAALTTANGTIMTGARSNYALGRDFRPLAALGRWRERGNTPAIALLVQGVICLILIAFGSKNGLEKMIDYVTPVFWMFFLLSGVSLFVLRYRDPVVLRPFRVPLYPYLPAVFCAVCMYMLWSSLNYAGRYAWIGLAVVAAGAPLLVFSSVSRRDGAIAAPPPAVPTQT
jgi:amino acid transporter